MKTFQELPIYVKPVRKIYSKKITTDFLVFSLLSLNINIFFLVFGKAVRKQDFDNRDTF